MHKFLTQTQFSHDRTILLYGKLAVVGLALIYLVLTVSASGAFERYAAGNHPALSLAQVVAETDPITLNKGGQQTVFFPEAGNYAIFATEMPNHKLPSRNYQVTVQTTSGELLNIKPNDSIQPSILYFENDKPQWNSQRYTLFEVEIPTAGEYQLYTAVEDHGRILTDEVPVAFVRDVTWLNLAAYWVMAIVVLVPFMALVNGAYVSYFKQPLKEERVLSDFRRGRLEQFMYEKE